MPRPRASDPYTIRVTLDPAATVSGTVAAGSRVRSYRTAAGDPDSPTHHLIMTTVQDRPFLSDVKTLREKARRHIERGAVTEGYRADRETVLKLLDTALATELVCV
ncbi:MAG: hypothetical protein R3344_14735, partial [Acidobacteriota bacterium]|nr:hypothetical protein [Acidobacteriota bacterium]